LPNIRQGKTVKEMRAFFIIFLLPLQTKSGPVLLNARYRKVIAAIFGWLTAHL
jgi:hypothetical protein